MSVFRFKQFDIQQNSSAMKVGTDAMVLGALIDPSSHKTALDIGTGTGVLSLMLAQKSNELQIQAIELDTDACQEATYNVLQSRFSSQIQVVEGDFFTYPFETKYDLIFSNPPYFNATFLPNNEQRALARHAHFSFDAFFQRTIQLLNPDGELWLILPLETWEEIEKNQLFSPLFCKEEISIWGNPSKIVRKIIRFSFKEQERVNTNFVIRNQSGTYSDEYIVLTQAFHANKLN